MVEAQLRVPLHRLKDTDGEDIKWFSLLGFDGKMFSMHRAKDGTRRRGRSLGPIRGNGFLDLSHPFPQPRGHHVPKHKYSGLHQCLDSITS